MITIDYMLRSESSAWRSIALKQLVALIFVVLVSSIVIVRTMVAEMDRQGQNETLEMVRGAFSRDMESAAESVSAIASSDDAVHHLSGTPDTQWFHFITASSGVPGYLLDANGKTLLNNKIDVSLRGDFGDNASILLPRLLRKLRTESLNPQRHVWVLFGLFAGQPAMVVGARIGHVAPRKGEADSARYLVLVVPVTKFDIAGVARTYGLQGLRLSEVGEPAPARASYSFGNDGERSVAMVQWQPVTPGSVVLRKHWLPLFLIVAVFLTIAIFLANQIHRSTQALAEKGRAANASVTELIGAVRSANTARAETQAALSEAEQLTQALNQSRAQQAVEQKRHILELIDGADRTALALSHTIGEIATSLLLDAEALDQRAAAALGAVALQANQSAAARDRSMMTANNSASIIESLKQLVQAACAIRDDARRHHSEIRASAADAQAAKVRQAELRQEVMAIASAADKIDEIAYRTDLLALNASIEAARAGSQSSGFAVVASEIKVLASQTGSITAVIGAAVRRIDTSSLSTSAVVDKINELLSDLSVSTMNSMAAVEQHEQETARIQQLTNQVELDAKETDAAVLEIAEAARGLSISAHDSYLIGERLRKRAVRLNHELTIFVAGIRETTKTQPL